ncbi:MAG: hypothetical protein IPK07_23085 [Deltaproteobacteria bacterium]|nr:hypothetical protein [Deltaproteobacteria bacterium]
MPISKVSILTASFLLCSATSFAEPVSRLATLQADAIIIGMETAEQHVQRGSCLRYFVCIEDADPSAEVKSRISASYAAVRWCSDRGRVKVPNRCQQTQITVHEPLTPDRPVNELEYSVGGTVNLRCTVRLDAGRPTTGKTCRAVRP